MMNTLLRALKHKWAARSVAILVGLALLLEIAHALGLLEAIPLSEARITDAILVGTFLLGFLLIETFGENEHTVQELSDKIRKLSHQFDASASVARFSDKYQFHSNWKHMRQTYSSFTVLGAPIPAFYDQFDRIAADKKRCRFCLAIDEETQLIATSYLKLANQTGGSTFELSEYGASITGSWLIAHDSTGNGVEAMFCFPPSNENSADGMYLTGAAAKAAIGSISPLLLSRNVGGRTRGPVRIYSEQQIEIILGKKDIFSREMLDVENGLWLNGAEEVCDAMIGQLAKAKKFLDVTHVCKEKTIPLLHSDQFIAWIAANYDAVQKGVVVTRIFLIPRALRKNAVLLEVIASMRAKGVHVLTCDWEGLDERLREDFSLYDDEHVVYISHESGGAWLDEDETRARISDSLERVRQFRGIFNAIKQRSK